MEVEEEESQALENVLDDDRDYDDDSEDIDLENGFEDIDEETLNKFRNMTKEERKDYINGLYAEIVSKMKGQTLGGLDTFYPVPKTVERYLKFIDDELVFVEKKECQDCGADQRLLVLEEIREENRIFLVCVFWLASYNNRESII